MAEEFTLTGLGDEEMKDCVNHFLADIRRNPNNFSYWFPKIENCGVPVPKSVIIQLPDDIIQSLFLGHDIVWNA